jgi:hypothetical protein
VVVARSVKVIGTARGAPVIDGTGIDRLFRVVAGGYLEVSLSRGA